MKVFCVHCGAGKDVEPENAGNTFTCATCGKAFALSGSTARQAAPRSDTGTKVALIIGAVVLAIPVLVAVIGIVAAIAIPNFIRYRSRAKQAECKTTLKAMYVAERSYFEEHATYVTDVQALGFGPTPAQRYRYFVDEERAGDAQLPKQLAGKVHVGLNGTCPADCSLVLACVGNVDRDGEADVWSLSTADRQGPDGLIKAGTPYNDENDLN